MKAILATIALIAIPFAIAAETADLVIVNKSESTLYLLRDGKRFATFPVAFGDEPSGHKRQQGDERTPEGNYVLDAKNAKSDYYKAIHVSYPNAKDIADAKSRGVDPGGAIMIHGQPNGWGWLAPIMQWFDWTDGCIALTNDDMDAVWKAVAVGTPIEIAP